MKKAKKNPVLPAGKREHLKEKICGTKNRYISAEHAAQAVEMYGGDKLFKQYFCEYCSLFHNASK